MALNIWSDLKPADDAGIRFVHQDLGLVGMLNAIDNLAITAGYQTGRGGRIRWWQAVKFVARPGDPRPDGAAADQASEPVRQVSVPVRPAPRSGKTAGQE